MELNNDSCQKHGLVRGCIFVLLTRGGSMETKGANESSYQNLDMQKISERPEHFLITPRPVKVRVLVQKGTFFSLAPSSKILKFGLQIWHHQKAPITSYNFFFGCICRKWVRKKVTA